MFTNERRHRWNNGDFCVACGLRRSGVQSRGPNNMWYTTAGGHVLGFQPGPCIRPVVGRFVEALETKLDANEHKGGWQNDTPQALLARLREETDELAAAIESGADAAHILGEAADVANFAMMVADVCGSLGKKGGAS